MNELNNCTENVKREFLNAKRIVVKIGTNCLTDKNSKLDTSNVNKVVSDLTNLIEDGREVILVSSGAIGAGVGRISLEETPEDMESLQAASTIGQGALMRRYSESFEKQEKHVAQLLLTRQD